MKANHNYLFLLALILFLPLLHLGQFTVTKISGQNPNAAADGFYYSLPRTFLQVDLTVEKIERVRGPLAEYSLNYLGTDDYISSNSTTYRVLNVNLRSVAEADPEQLYYVSFPSERSKDENLQAFQLTEIGTLLAFDNEVAEAGAADVTTDQTIVVMQGEDDFRYYPDYHRKKKIDTITRRITIDTVSIERFIFRSSWVDKSNEDKANEAALQISHIREARFNLLTGYQEVNYGESMKYMDSQLSRMEQQYLELFLGKERKSYENITVSYLPSVDRANEVLHNLPDNSNIEISISPRGNTSTLPETVLEKQGNIYYRVPEMVDVSIRFKGQLLQRSSILISHLGKVTSAPLTNSRLQFDAETGSLTKIVRE